MKTKNIIIFIFSCVLLFSITDRISWRLFETDIKFFRTPIRIILKVIKGIRSFLIFGIITSILFLFAKEGK